MLTSVVGLCEICLALQAFLVLSLPTRHSRRNMNHNASTALAMQVYEFLDSDLECLIRDRATIISAADVKSYMQMLLKGLVSCHKHWILHRDIKPNNFLISMSGALLLPPLSSSLTSLIGTHLICHSSSFAWQKAPSIQHMSSLVHAGMLQVYAVSPSTLRSSSAGVTHPHPWQDDCLPGNPCNAH